MYLQKGSDEWKSYNHHFRTFFLNKKLFYLFRNYLETPCMANKRSNEIHITYHNFYHEFRHLLLEDHKMNAASRHPVLKHAKNNYIQSVIIKR